MMKPKAQNEHEEGMLEYLEDIIGSNRFKEPIELLTVRIDKIHEVRAEKVRQSYIQLSNLSKYLTIRSYHNSWCIFPAEGHRKATPPPGLKPVLSESPST